MPSHPSEAPPLVAVTADIRNPPDYPWHAAPEAYLTALTRGAGAIPLIVPSLGQEIDPERLLDRVDGLLVTGSRSNVHPSLYGAEPSKLAEPYDAARDATSLPLIRAALRRGMPVLAICRGLQELNVALGGTLTPAVHELPGRIDHRAPEAVPDEAARWAIHQPVEVVGGGCLAAIVGSGPIAVNSLHHQAIDRLADRLAVEALAPDGTVEAVSVRDAPGFALGVQWHPEYWVGSDPPSSRLFAGFGAALRAAMAARRNAPA